MHFYRFRNKLSIRSISLFFLRVCRFQIRHAGWFCLLWRYSLLSSTLDPARHLLYHAFTAISRTTSAYSPKNILDQRPQPCAIHIYIYIYGAFSISSNARTRLAPSAASFSMPSWQNSASLHWAFLARYHVKMTSCWSWSTSHEITGRLPPRPRVRASTRLLNMRVVKYTK